MERQVSIVFINYQKMTHGMCQVSLVVSISATTDIIVNDASYQTYLSRDM